MSAIGTSWDGPGPPSVVVVRAHLAELRRRDAAAGWMWFEFRDRERRRAEARVVLERAMRAEPPRLVFGSAS